MAPPWVPLVVLHSVVVSDWFARKVLAEIDIPWPQTFSAPPQAALLLINVLAMTVVLPPSIAPPSYSDELEINVSCSRYSRADGPTPWGACSGECCSPLSRPFITAGPSRIPEVTTKI